MVEPEEVVMGTWQLATHSQAVRSTGNNLGSCWLLKSVCVCIEGRTGLVGLALNP